MHNISSVQQPDAATLLQRLDVAVYSFGLDHNARRMQAAVAASMAGVQLPLEVIMPHLEKCLVNDPHARDLQAQITEARNIMRRIQ